MEKRLINLLEKTESWKELIRAIVENRIISLYGMSDGQKALITAAIKIKTGRPIVFITSMEKEAYNISKNISQTTNIKTDYLPAQVIQFGKGAFSLDKKWKRLEVLSKIANGKVEALCVPAASMSNRQIPKAHFIKSKIDIKLGSNLEPGNLIKQLIQKGYENVKKVEQKGQCAIRGDIVDIFPSNKSKGIRVEFFGNEIDSIRNFDLIDQRSIFKCDFVDIAPANEVVIQKDNIKNIVNKMKKLSKEALDNPSYSGGTTLLDDELHVNLEDNLENHIKNEIEESLTNIEAGYPFRKIQNWIHIISDETVSIDHWFEKPIIILDHPDRTKDSIESNYNIFLEEFKNALIRYEAAPIQSQLLYNYSQILLSLKKHTILTMSDFLKGMGKLEPEKLIKFDSIGTYSYRSNFPILSKDIKNWQSAGYKIFMFAGNSKRGERLQKYLYEHEISSTYIKEKIPEIVLPILISPNSYSQGFIWKDGKLIFITDKEIFGASYQRLESSGKDRLKSNLFTDLSEGDYVVHEDHGVGIYKGLTSLISEGLKRDYIYIQYRGSDKLYIPTDQLHKVQKFIGIGEGTPRLNRLGGGEWQKEKRKVKKSIKTLAFDLAKLYATRQAVKGYEYPPDTPWQADFEDRFPFELTSDQEQSIQEIKKDMESSINMDRLLCGDVGYGKTEVAMRAAFKAIMDGKQVAILAPTTILVQQHFSTVLERMEGFPIKIDFLSRFKTLKEQKKTIEKIIKGEIDLIIGTHRLLSKDIKYRNIGLLIIDEEQRFGVAHKEIIKNMKAKLDVLTLSATPIPRTMHMSMIGIRDISILETPPEERFPIETHVLEYNDILIRDIISREISRGGQVYFVYNQVKSIDFFHSRLKNILPDIKIGIAHGQMREKILEDTMVEFFKGNYNVLLCTTIIENGLDVSDANTIIIYDADKFGLSQLYQLRGRVGRSNVQAYAYFTIRQDKAMTEVAEKRLSAIKEFTEFGAGFRIALKDLEIRGAGNVLGPEQHGQLSTVGYDMYTKLVEEAVTEIKGSLHPKIDLPDTKIDIPIEAYLPETYVEDKKQRLELYKRIASIKNEEIKLDVTDELIDRYGEVPDSVENLMKIALLKENASKMGIKLIFVKKQGIYFRFDEQTAPEPEKLITAIGRTNKELSLLPTSPITMLLPTKKDVPEIIVEKALNTLVKVLNIIKNDNKN